MKRRMFLVLALFVSLAEQVGGADIKVELQNLQGVWKLVKLERGGQSSKDTFLPQARVVVDGNTLRFKVGDKTLQEIGFKLEPGKNPAAINLTAASGPAKGKTALGIYRLDGKRLTLCWPVVNDQQRPAAFGKKAGPDVATLTLERE